MLATVHRNNRASSIGVLQKMVAAFGADNLKPCFVQGSDKAVAGDGWEGAHMATAMRWTPTNSLATGSSTSRQSSIASLILFIKTSKDLA